MIHILDNLPQYVLSERKKRKLTLKEVSDLTGISISILSRVENGNGDMNVKNFVKFITGLNITTDSDELEAELIETKHKLLQVKNLIKRL